MEHEQHIKEESEERKSDTSETWLRETYPEAFRKLLLDHTTHRNIIWATDSYMERGSGYTFHDEIRPELITGENGDVIQPRSRKAQQEQQRRVKDKAEVFTPSWICNAQNNLIDEAWFGYPNAFNEEVTLEDGTHTWIPTEGKIQFPDAKGKTWRKYVRDMRLEITCGEAPYLVNRYDAPTGNRFDEKVDPATGETTIDLNMRVGLLDRKLRVVSENTETSGKWLEWARKALENTYGYEWQGDSLLLAREAVFMTVFEYYHAKFGEPFKQESANWLAYIISWNLWQMDGLKYVIPGSCERAAKAKSFRGHQMSLPMYDSEPEEEVIVCPACKTGKGEHIGTYAKIRDWKVWGPLSEEKRALPQNKIKTDIPFIQVVNRSK